MSYRDDVEAGGEQVRMRCAYLHRGFQVVRPKKQEGCSLEGGPGIPGATVRVVPLPVQVLLVVVSSADNSTDSCREFGIDSGSAAPTRASPRRVMDQARDYGAAHGWDKGLIKNLVLLIVSHINPPALLLISQS